jgi:predicted amidohydrolase
VPLPTDHPLWLYRLAKFEVAAERRGVGRLSFARFEEDLATHLAALEHRTSAAHALFADLDAGNVWIRPKSIELKEGPGDGSAFVTIPELADDHQIKELSVRVLLEPTPEFSIAEVIWLRTFGPALETMLTRACWGNRLELKDSPGNVPAGGRRLFRYWAPAYRNFKNRAIDAAKWSLRHGDRRCILITLDLTTYYDNIDPAFLVANTFITTVTAAAVAAGVPFDADEYRDATQGLLQSFNRFRAKVRQVVGVERDRGIPIGALTSRLIANLALAELDKAIQAVPGVRYYGRYVDDILLVYEPGDLQFDDARTVVELFVPLDKAASTAKKLAADAVALGRAGSSFVIQTKKMRVFDMKGMEGLEYLKAVEAEIRRVSSERRRFLDPWAAELDQTVMASPNAEPIRALREADALSLRRLAVGTVSDKVATAASMLNRDEAASFSRRFLGKVGRLATDWSRWVDLIDVSLRVLGSALISGARAATLDGGATPAFTIKWGDDELKEAGARTKLKEWVEEQLIEVIAGAAPIDSNGKLPAGLEVVKDGIVVRGSVLKGLALSNRARRLAMADLRLLDRETDEQLGNPRVPRQQAVLAALAAAIASDAWFMEREAGIKEFLAACADLQDPTFAPMTPVDVLLLFRAPTYFDLLYRWIRAERQVSDLVAVVNAVRGNRYKRIPMEYDDQSQTLFVDPPTENPFDPAGDVGRTKVALGNLRTEESWWAASLTKPALTDERQKRLTRVINQALDAAKHADGRPTLLVLPELSLPRRWLRQVCSHLARSEPLVSLVAGLEYDVAGTKVYNEALAFFPRRYFSAALWMWTKRRPAHHEAPELQELGFTFARRSENRRFVRVSSEHGRFLPLICSELLEVDTRKELLDRVDFVLIPAWNPDTTSFEHLVHASALELHSFVAVANNGLFSDCRIRGPYAEAWQREVCRMIARGSDEVVSEMLPLHQLREYRADPKTYMQRIANWSAAAAEIKRKLKAAKKSKKKLKLTQTELDMLTPDGKRVLPCPWPAWKPAPPNDKWPGNGA